MPSSVTLNGTEWAGADPLVARFTIGSFRLNQPAGVYPLLTATGDVWIESVTAYVKTAAAGLTSITITTNHTTPKTVVASTLLAAITNDLTMTIATPLFGLPTGKAIRGTIVGTGTAGLIYVMARWVPLTFGATLT